MATTTINPSIIFTSIFATITTADELKNVANALAQELTQAFKVRQAELAKTAEPVGEAIKKKTKAPIVEAAPTPAKAKAEPKAAPAKGKKASTDEIAITDLKAIKKLGLKLEKYSEKSYVLRGDTKPLASTLGEQFKGRFNKWLKGGEGWIFTTKNAQELATALKLAI